MAKNVLIADDDLDIAQSLTLRLRELGVTVFRSPDASHALMGALKVRPDLVILDVNMPGGNGLAVCEMLLGDKQLRRVPVIIYTGLTDPGTIVRCKHLGALYVKKIPGSLGHVAETVRKMLALPRPGAALTETASVTCDTQEVRPARLEIAAESRPEETGDAESNSHHPLALLSVEG